MRVHQKISCSLNKLRMVSFVREKGRKEEGTKARKEGIKSNPLRTIGTNLSVLSNVKLQWTPVREKSQSFLIYRYCQTIQTNFNHHRTYVSIVSNLSILSNAARHAPGFLYKVSIVSNLSILSNIYNVAQKVGFTVSIVSNLSILSNCCSKHKV